MSFSIGAKIPEQYNELVKKKIIFSASKRLSWIAPFVSAFMLFVSIADVFTELWGEQSISFFYIDLVCLILVSTITITHFINKPASPDDIKTIHIIHQNGLAGIIIVWSAFITRVDYVNAGGYSTLIISMLLCAGLLVINFRLQLVFSAIAVLLIYVDSELFKSLSDMHAVVPGVILIAVVVVLAIVINQININSLLKSFILELELEKKVDERTKQLAEETAKAQQADKMKTVFLANMSHEIRTPLNGILGFSNLLRDERLKSNKRQEYVDIVIKSGNTLLEILNGIIEVSRIEAGEVELLLEEFCLNDIVSEVVAGFNVHPKVQSNDIVLLNDCEHAEPVILISDRLKLVQILINLVNNALKYTDSGVVTAGFKFSGDKEISIYVKDTGRGIKTEDQKMIFERFQQVDKTPYSSKEGVGLGLTIVNGYVALLKGRLELESVADQGSEFRVTVPKRFYEE